LLTHRAWFATFTRLTIQTIRSRIALQPLLTTFSGLTTRAGFPILARLSALTGQTCFTLRAGFTTLTRLSALTTLTLRPSFTLDRLWHFCHTPLECQDTQVHLCNYQPTFGQCCTTLTNVVADNRRNDSHCEVSNVLGFHHAATRCSMSTFNR
jgi:hypothetical protein